MWRTFLDESRLLLFYPLIYLFLVTLEYRTSQSHKHVQAQLCHGRRWKMRVKACGGRRGQHSGGWERASKSTEMVGKWGTGEWVGVGSQLNLDQLTSCANGIIENTFLLISVLRFLSQSHFVFNISYILGGILWVCRPLDSVFLKTFILPATVKHQRAALTSCWCLVFVLKREE